MYSDNQVAVYVFFVRFYCMQNSEILCLMFTVVILRELFVLLF